MKRRNRGSRSRCFRVFWMGLVLGVTGLQTRQGRASVALLMEEPYGELGRFDPAGHAAVYLNHICADSPVRLRPCESGELGVVISRYHKIHKQDWIAVPLVPYLYAVEDVRSVPKSATKAEVATLRNAYWREHLTELAPPTKDGGVPDGEWTQLVGSSYDRKIHGFQIETTAEEDAVFIARFNDRRNVGHFNVLFHNCADFSRVVLDLYFPDSVHRSFIADLGVMTPKQVAKSLVKYGRKHPELKMSAFTILQVAGDLPRSHAVKGVDESLVKSKKYLLPLAVLYPPLAGALVVGYLSEGRMKLPADATIFEVGDDRPPVEKPATSASAAAPAVAPSTAGAGPGVSHP